MVGVRSPCSSRLPQQLKPIHARHKQVAEDYAGGMFRVHFERLATVLGGYSFETEGCHHFGEHPTLAQVVVNYQDTRRGRREHSSR